MLHRVGIVTELCMYGIHTTDPSGKTGVMNEPKPITSRWRPGEIHARIGSEKDIRGSGLALPGETSARARSLTGKARRKNQKLY